MKSVSLCYLVHKGESDLSQINEQLMHQWLSELPSLKQASVLRFLNISDRMTSLLATRLLLRCAQRHGIQNFRLSDIHYPAHGKPRWQSQTGDFFDFNISHTDKLIIVAASKSMKVGVDAEKIRGLKNLNFKRVMSSDELAKIQQTPRLFFDIWSKKEAVVKAANTRGLERMRDVQLKQEHAILDNIKWHINNIEIKQPLSNEYAIHLATSMPVDNVIMQQEAFSDLISQ